MKRFYDNEIQVCSNEIPGVTNGHALRGHSFIYIFIAKTFYSHEPLDGMHWYLSLKFKFVPKMFLGSQMPRLRERVYIEKSFKNLMNHCIYIWLGASLEQGYSNLFKLSLWG